MFRKLWLNRNGRVLNSRQATRPLRPENLEVRSLLAARAYELKK